MQLKHIITLLLKFVSNHEVQVRSPVLRYLYWRYTKNLLKRYRCTIHSWCIKPIQKYRMIRVANTSIYSRYCPSLTADCINWNQISAQ